MRGYGSIQAKVGRVACLAENPGVVVGQELLQGMLVFFVNVDEFDAVEALAGDPVGRDMGGFSPKSNGVVAEMQRDVAGRASQKDVMGGGDEAQATIVDIVDPVGVAIDFGEYRIIVDNGLAIVFADYFLQIGIRELGPDWSDRQVR